MKNLSTDLNNGKVTLNCAVVGVPRVLNKKRWIMIIII